MHAQQKFTAVGLAFFVSLTTQAFGLSNVAESFEDGPVFELDETESALDDSRRSDSCTEINLYAKKGPLNSVPIYEQGESYLCYAYVVAQMSEYALRKSGEWQSTFGNDAHLNNLWAALAYKTGKNLGIRIRKNTLGSGYFQTAYHDLADRGVCDPVIFERSLAQFKGKSLLSDPDFVYLFEEIWLMNAKNEISTVNLDSLLARKDLQRMQARIFPVEGAQAMKAELIHIVDQVRAIPSEWFEKNREMDYYSDVVFPACSSAVTRPMSFPKTRSMGMGFASRAKLKRNIDEVLDSSDPDPITIGYCAKIYHEGEVAEKAGKRKVLLPRFFRAFDEKSCSTHYSMVVGRKRSSKTGKCEYLIRNTTGRDFWTKKSSCVCEKTDGSGYEECAYDPVLSPKSDRVVGCYIDERPLLNSVYDLVFLDR